MLKIGEEVLNAIKIKQNQITDLEIKNNIAVISGNSLGTTVPSGAVNYVGQGNIGGEMYTRSIVIPFDGTLKNLIARSDGSPGVGQFYYCDLFVNGVQTSLTAPIVSGTNLGTDYTRQIAVKRADRIILRVSSTVSAVATNINWSVAIIPN